MKRGWARIVFLTFIFCLPVAAAAMHIFGVATIKDADYRQKNNNKLMDIAIQLIVPAGSNAEVPLDACTKQLTDRFSACTDAQYNLIVTDNQGTVQYRQNGNFISGNHITLYDFGAMALLTDDDDGKTMYTLNAETLYSDTESTFTNPPAFQTDTVSAKSLSATIAVISDRTYIVLYDNAAEKYLTVTYPGIIRARGESLLTLSAAVFAAFWLGLALWVFFDARRLGLSGWKWGGWTLALNLAGFTAYIVARSHGFGTETCCVHCNRPVDKAWVRCPFCGEKPEEPVMP